MPSPSHVPGEPRKTFGVMIQAPKIPTVNPPQNYRCGKLSDKQKL